MANVFVNETALEDIADAIRSKNGSQTTYKPGEMAAAIEAISGGITPTGTVSITQNGTTDVTQYASASVNVPNSYAASDEGKVVSDGALVAQSSDTVTANDTYDTTLINSLTVNVSGGGGTLPTCIKDYVQLTPASDITNSNKASVQLTPVSNWLIVIFTSETLSPPASGTIALFGAAGQAISKIYLSALLRANGTQGSDSALASNYNPTTGVLTLGSSYSVFLTGVTYEIFLFEMGGANV